MGKELAKTNAMRALEQRKIAYTAHSYSPEIHSAEGAAASIGAELAQVYKTLVVLPESGQGRPLLVMVPGNKELNLKLLGSAIGEKKLRMASQREAESLTGLLVGGIGALALLNKGFRVFIDDEALHLDLIFVNGGQRGLNLSLSPTDLLNISAAQPVVL